MDLYKSRPISSSMPSTRKPLRGPSRTSAGLVPIKVGLPETCPFTTVKCKLRWWPSKRMPQGSVSLGSPNRVRKYLSELRRPVVSFS